MNRKVIRAALALLAAAMLVVLLAMPVTAALGEPEPDDDPFTEIEPITPELEDSPLLDNAPGGPGSQDPNISININGEASDTVRIILLITILSVLPSLLLMMTSFTRIIIVFSLLRNAMGLQQTPPNQVLIGIALFLSLFVMQPVLTEVNEVAYQPYSEGEIETDEFLERATAPVKGFMLDQTKPEDLNMFVSLSGRDRPEVREEYTMDVVVPAFLTSEIKRAFTIGFLLYIPFLVIDMVVASALMSMGMMMLPPVTISMPFKLMLFVLVDGWGLLIKTLIQTFNIP